MIVRTSTRNGTIIGIARAVAVRGLPGSVQRRALGWLLLLTFAACVLLGVAEAQLASGRPAAQINARSRELPLLLTGMHGRERDDRAPFRWTTGDTTLTFEQPPATRALLLALQLGPPPSAAASTFDLGIGGTAFATLPVDPRPRIYRVLVPRALLQAGDLAIRLRVATVQVGDDPRPIGLRFERATLTAPNTTLAWPAPLQLLAQSLLLVGTVLLLGRLNVSLRLVALTLVALTLALALLYALPSLLTYRYVLRLAGAMWLLLLLTIGLLPRAERWLAWAGPPAFVRLLWSVLLLACAIRLGASLYPLFSAYDLQLNLGRLVRVATGTLVVTGPSIEFRGGVTVYPPGPYLVFLPGLLTGLSPALLVQGGVALVDALGALTTALLARRLGASQRAAMFAALLYAAIPINLTALWFGLSAQIFGQALMPLLALALLAALERADRRAWLVAGGLLCVALLSHIGVAIVALAWLGLAWLLAWRRETLPPAARWRWFALLALCGLVAFALIYVDVAALKLREAQTVSERVANGGGAPYRLIARGFLIAFHALGLWLLPSALLLSWRRLPRGASALLGGWLAVVILFWLVEMASRLQVRYIYFFAPLACILIARVLDRLAARGPYGPRLAWVVVALLLAQGSALWLTSAWSGAQMSMVSLLR